MTVDQILAQRFGHDSILALATVSNGLPSVRYVDALWQDDAFYIITYELSGKMQQIASQPIVGLAGEWFTGHGIARNLGWFGLPENAAIAQSLRQAFAAWIDNGHNDFNDHHTIILQVMLTDCVVFADGVRYEMPKSK